MKRANPGHAWRPWRDTIIAVVAVIAIASLASANPSLRAPRGPHESVLIVPTGATESSGPTVTNTTPETEPGEEGESPSDGVDFTACEGLTGLANAICRNEALLAVHPDDQGLQNSLAHLLELRAEHEARGEGRGGNAPPEHGSSSSSDDHDHGHGQSAEPHGDADGKDHSNNGSDNGGNGKDH
jgi:hypothetical protein